VLAAGALAAGALAAGALAAGAVFGAAVFAAAAWAVDAAPGLLIASGSAAAFPSGVFGFVAGVFGVAAFGRATVGVRPDPLCTPGRAVTEVLAGGEAASTGPAGSLAADRPAGVPGEEPAGAPGEEPLRDVISPDAAGVGASTADDAVAARGVLATPAVVGWSDVVGGAAVTFAGSGGAGGHRPS
jgi:hypothetical protein